MPEPLTAWLTMSIRPHVVLVVRPVLQTNSPSTGLAEPVGVAHPQIVAERQWPAVNIAVWPYGPTRPKPAVQY